LKAEGLPGLSPREAIDRPEVVQLYAERIARQLAALPPYEHVKRFRLLDCAFTIEEGHLTPKLSLRRDVLNRRFHEEITSLYNGGGVAVQYEPCASRVQVEKDRCDTV
jgi:long-chain acyl-CoA synthetase